MQHLAVAKRVYDQLDDILRPLSVRRKLLGAATSEFEKRVDIVADVEFRDWSKRLFIEVKARGEPFHIRNAIVHGALAAQSAEDSYACIVAPYLSDWTRDMARKLGVGAFDLAGNVLIDVDGIYIERSGRRATTSRGAKTNLFSRSATKVYQTLLGEPDRAWTPAELAGQAGVSRALIYKLEAGLAARGFVQEEVEGRRRLLRLVDKEGLLDAWKEAKTPGAHAPPANIEEELAYYGEREEVEP